MTRLSFLLFLAVASLSVSATAGATSSGEATETDLRRMTQELLDAIAPGERGVWDRRLDERFVHIDENGVVRGKAELLEELDPLPVGLMGRIEIDRFETTIHGKTALAAYEVQEFLDYHGQPLRSRFRSLDTWLATPKGWRLIGMHTAAVLKDPPAMSLTPQALCEFEGVYSLTPAIKTRIRCVNGKLTSERADRPIATYAAELRDVFFQPGQPRTRRIFTRDNEGRVDGFVDRREGEDVRWNKDRVPDRSGHSP